MEQETVVEETPEAPPEPPPIPEEVVQEALDTGWLPEDQFKGDKTKWRPADQWVERGKTLIPIIKKQNQGLVSEVRTLKQTLEAQKKTTERLLKMSEKAQQRAYEQAKRELEIKQMEAVKEGDTETWAKLKDEENKLEKPEPITPEVPQDGVTPEFEAWHTGNTWYRAVGTTEGDLDMTIYADGYASSLMKQDPTLTHEQVLTATEKKVKEVFKHKFENPNRNLPSSVDSSTIAGGETKPTGKTYADLPADAKKQCNILIAEGLIKNKEQYVKDYFEEE